MTDPEESLAAERVIEALGRPPKSHDELIRECKVGEVVPLECFADHAKSNRVKVPFIPKKHQLSVFNFEGSSLHEKLGKPKIDSLVFERTEAGWMRVEDEKR